MNKICVYAICKNEIKSVEKWYESMSEADCVVVLDTGSTDGTVEKLKSLGANVIQQIIKPWRFDVARNISMNLAPNDCNILVCTDIDQVFTKGWADILKKNWIDGYHRMCWYKFVYSHTNDGDDDCVFMYNKIHARGYKWYFPVHECLDMDPEYAEELNKMHDLVLGDDFKVHNYPVYSNSHDSYLPLLKLRMEENPEIFSSFQYLTHQYFYDGQIENCIDLGKKTLNKFEGKVSQFELSNICFFIGLSYRVNGNYSKAIEFLSKGISYDETYRENYLELAEIYLFNLKDDVKYVLAYNILKTCMEKTFQHFSWLEKDGSFGYKIYDMLSIAAYYSGHKTESLLYAFIAREKNKKDDRLQNNVNLILNQLTDKNLAEWI